MRREKWNRGIAMLLSVVMLFTLLPGGFMGTVTANADSSGGGTETTTGGAITTTGGAITVEKITDGYKMTSDYFKVETGKYGQITSLKLVGDEFDTNYVLNADNAAPQGVSDEHQWMGELMFQTKVGDATGWTKSMTSASKADSAARKVTLEGNKVVVTYQNETTADGIKDFQLVETYELVGDKLQWSMKVTNTNDKAMTFGDFGLPMPFNEYWSGTQGYNYEERVIDHSFVGQDSSYIYATRPSGQGRFLLFTPQVSTGAKLEYQDHWRVNNGHADSAWAMDQGGWANGLNVFYIHSNAIKSTGSSYLTNTELTLLPGESKEYSFNFSGVANETAMKTRLYNEGVIDAVAVPGMAFAINMPAKFYLHTKYNKDEINSVEVKCPHETGVYEGRENSVSNKQACTKAAGTSVTYAETKVIDGEQYHIYNLKLTDLGANNVVVKYANGKETTLQFYAMPANEDALALHAKFVAEKTQVSAPGQIHDKIFDDWMMDTKNVRGVYQGYFGWGDDWGFTHGEYLAEKNVYQPVAAQITAVDEYLDTFIWNSLMKEHHEDYLVNDWLDKEPNTTGQGTNRGYAYLHAYNTYFAMYQIADKYPDMIKYKESKETYLLRTYNILKALYKNNIDYAWVGLMGESTTPDIIAALQKEGFNKEASVVIDYMNEKYQRFKDEKYPYGSEYPYDNTGEEAVYTLADLQNNNVMMQKIDWKTRACRGVQPIWYHYANPTTICGENWWNFQYTASLAGYCMDNWLRLQDNGMTTTESAVAARVNYAAKLANLTCINSGQIDADPANIGTVGWTYQSELGNTGGLGTGGGKLHNGWRQMSGEADTGLFGALRILSSDVAIDPVFGLFGYGCNVTEAGGKYTVTPLDGVYSRLNLIDQKLSIELNRDQYTEATVNADATGVVLNMKNMEQTEHKSGIKVTGLKAGSYRVYVNDVLDGSFIAKDAQTSVINASLPAGTAAVVKIEAGTLTANTAPVVNAGEDKTTHVSDDFRLTGTATDDGQPDGTLTSSWTLTSSPAGSNPTIENADKLITNVKFDKAGAYEFKLTVTDGVLPGSDTVIVTVLDDEPLPEQMAYYTFDKISNKQVVDESGKGYNSALISDPVFAAAKSGNGIVHNGSYGGYVKMPKELTKRVNAATIDVDVKLNAAQSEGARLFQFGDTEGHKFYVAFDYENKLILGITDLKTNITNTVKSGLYIAPGHWQNIAVTLKDNTAILYVNGVEKVKMENCGFSFAGLGDVQQNYIGRSNLISTLFLDGIVDNFSMKSVAMSAEEIKSAYALTEIPTVVSADATVSTSVGTAPKLPTELKVLYSDGIYEVANVTWDSISADKYAKEGTFTVSGTIKGSTVKPKLKVIVAKGRIQNIALFAKPTAVIDTPNDLGGVKGLNDGFDPVNSFDRSHGVWHNWQGNKSGEAWVQYTWDSKVVLTGSEAYYYTDGNFKPATVKIQYLDDAGKWVTVSNAKGLGTDLNKYNVTTFDPIETTALRMVMTPEKQGCGVIEWIADGYSDKVVLKDLKIAITKASAITNKALFVSGWEELQTALKEATATSNDSNTTQTIVDKAAANLNSAILSMVPLKGNIAYFADATTSFVSSWEKLSAVNDGAVSAKSDAAGIPAHYGTWGNDSEYETVTYTWPGAVNISGSGLFIWNDGGGILTPKSYKYEYLDNSGNWVEITDAKGLGIELDKFNQTTFNEIKTHSLRITIYKPVKDANGIGLIEWEVYGTKAQEEVPADKTALLSVIKTADTKVEANYTKDSWAKFATALSNAKATAAKTYAAQAEVDSAKAALEAAINGLVVVANCGDDDFVPSIPKPDSKPADKPADKPTDKPADNPTDKPTDKKFEDMNKYQWANEAVGKLAADGIIHGTSDTTFEPGKKITRADFLLMLIKALNLKADFTENFSDISSNDYYYQALGIAKKLGIASGSGNNQFNPKAEISRQDMMVLVDKALKLAGKGLAAGTSADMAGFNDADDVSGYAENAVAALIKKGIIKGSGNAINPKSELTRAEAAVVIYKIYK